VFSGDCKLATVWVYSKDPKRAGEFYRNVLQMKQIEHGEINSFDGGGVRLSIHPAPKSMKEIPNGESFLVFYVKEGIDAKYEELKKRGVNFAGGISNETIGRTAHFKDPDGHEIFLWQPPSRESREFRHVSEIVNHFEGIIAKLESARV
jgi:predicted enzyme related to lactoylglutathione lyase